MPSPQRIIVGLGNPGNAYDGTRHNIGFALIGALDPLPSEDWTRKFKGRAHIVTIDKVACLLLLPQTFMNNSGESVQEAAAFYKLPTAAIIVVHDDIDLSAGEVRVKQGGGHAGHNGLRSIDAHLGRDYWRVRIGIGRPDVASQDVTSWVLGRFADQDKIWIDKLTRTWPTAFPSLVNSSPPDVVRFLEKLR